MTDEKPKNEIDENARLNNPAARVHAILAHASKIRATTILEGYASTFTLKMEQLGDIYRLLGLLDAEADEVARLLKELGETTHYELYLESLPMIKGRFLIQNFGAQWEQFRIGIRNEDLVRLRFCSDTLSKRHPEKTITSGELTSILDRVNKLYEEIAKSDTDPDLRNLILDQLENIRRAIHEYRVRGVGGLRQAVANCVLIVANDSRIRRACEESTEKRKSDDSEEASLLNGPVVAFVNLISSLLTIGLWEYSVLSAIAPAIQHLLSK
jgi:hypothetical protein